MMEAGELETKKAFEEVTTRNVRASVDFSNNTRIIMRELEKKVDLLEGQLRQYDEKLETLNKLLSNVQMKVYRGGTS